jgi:hypothetical protein
LSVKKSKDIFGNEIITIKGQKGQSRIIKTSKDIFNDVTKSVTDQDGKELLSIKKSKDIFGNLITTIKGDEEAADLNFLMRFLKTRGTDNEELAYW